MSVENLKKACGLIGSQAALGRMVGASPRQVSNWIHRDKQVPAAYCLKIEEATNGKVTCYDLRPLIFRAPPVLDEIPLHESLPAA